MVSPVCLTHGKSHNRSRCYRGWVPSYSHPRVRRLNVEGQHADGLVPHLPAAQQGSLEKGLYRAGDPILLVDQWEESPLVECCAWVRYAESKQIAYCHIAIRIEA